MNNYAIKEITMKKQVVYALAIVCVMCVFATVLVACNPPSPPNPPAPEVPTWESQISFSDNGIQLNLTPVEGATTYDIYYSPSRFGEYAWQVTQENLTFSHEDKYGYFRVDAMNGDQLVSSQLFSYDLELFGPNTSVYSPTDFVEDVNDEIQQKFAMLESAQFSSERYAALFKLGTYSGVRMQMGYYTTVSGLGVSPTEVTLGYFNVNAQWFNGNATHNFWRGIENVTVSGDVQWAVSQATSFRRMNVLGNMRLDDGGWSSGGYIADSKIRGSINSGGQQQWFCRNTDFNKYQNAGWSRVFLGCNGTLPSGSWPNTRVTDIQATPDIAEKPYIVFDSDGYGVFVPDVATNRDGISWEEQTEGYVVPLDDFYVARSDRDTAETLNMALACGKHLLFTPGVYKLDEALRVENADTIVLGIGLATLKITDRNTDALMIVSDVDGVSVSGLLFDAGTYSNALMRVGESKTGESHAHNKIRLADLYFRVGGAERANTSVDVCLEINSNDVVCDHFWIWRGDHSHGVGWAPTTEEGRYSNVTKNGIVVNGDNVTCYALMVEHFHQYQTVWNGENGATYFYQSEVPYDPIQADWTSHDGKVLGYASYKVGDNVTNHQAYGIGVYYFQSGCILENAIEAPSAPGVYFEHIFTQNLSGKKGGAISNIINGVGGPVDNDHGTQAITYYYDGQIQQERP